MNVNTHHNESVRRMLSCGSATAGKMKNKRASIKFSANSFITQCNGCFFDYYDVVELLGEGAYGEVFTCRHKESGELRAVKILDVSDSRQASLVLNEFNVLRGIDHPNLLKIYHLYEDVEEETCYIVSSLYEGGELFDEIEEWGNLSEQSTAVIMNQLLSCVNYCHSNGIVHRDLKPENILMADENMHLEDIKVIDFGLAATFDDYENDRFTDKVGSAYYIAPEILNGSYGPKCDVWSAGVIAFVLLSGDAPFYGETEAEVLKMVVKGKYSFEENEIWEEISIEAQEFVAWLLTFDEAKRPTAKEALSHPWLKKTRRISSLQQRKSKTSMKSLSNLELFSAESKLKQAVYAFISGQLIMANEKEEIDELFRALDTNCDGKLTNDELKQGYKDLLGRDLSEQELEDISGRVNFSGGGAITYSEFVVASMMSSRILDDGRLRAAFSEFDRDGSGVLTADDLCEALDLAKEDEATKDLLDKIMDQIDTDKDGSISYEEFKRAMLSPSCNSEMSTEKRRPGKKQFTSRRSWCVKVVEEPVGSHPEKSFELRKSQSLALDGLFRRLVSSLSNAGSRRLENTPAA
ncbi:MAP kinase-activated protein kinase 2 (Fragment) [Seminavis robusta]|uniref:non-specific serine/threonine protein kinase n=1 Tax=Seminavis robusta TaxID=568900 RepID=A0A9N8EK65_9STRA